MKNRWIWRQIVNSKFPDEVQKFPATFFLIFNLKSQAKPVNSKKYHFKIFLEPSSDKHTPRLHSLRTRTYSKNLSNFLPKTFPPKMKFPSKYLVSFLSRISSSTQCHPLKIKTWPGRFKSVSRSSTDGARRGFTVSRLLRNVYIAISFYQTESVVCTIRVFWKRFVRLSNRINLELSGVLKQLTWRVFTFSYTKGWS